jgi:transposase
LMGKKLKVELLKPRGQLLHFDSNIIREKAISSSSKGNLKWNQKRSMKDFKTIGSAVWKQTRQGAERSLLCKSIHTVHSEKVMLTIIWNSNSFHLINVIWKGIKFNANHYLTRGCWYPCSVARMAQNSDRWRRAKLIVHADNARPHMARVTLELLKHNGMKRAPHPPYSPDLVPSDFYLWSLISSATSSNSWQDTNFRIENHLSRQSDTFWRALKKLP